MALRTDSRDGLLTFGFVSVDPSRDEMLLVLLFSTLPSR